MSIKPTEVPRKLPVTGETYNPYGLPQVHRAIRACQWLSDRAKLVWGALADRAGKNALLYPKNETIGEDIGGVDARLVRRYMQELETARLIRRSTRLNSSGRRSSNNIEFLWRPLCELAAPSPDSTDPTARTLQAVEPGLYRCPSPDSTDPRTNSVERSTNERLEEVCKELELRRTDSSTVCEPMQGRPSHSASEIKTMRHSLEAYMARPAAGPNGTWAARPLRDDLVHRCLDAGRGASAEEISRHLGELYRREQAPFNDSGPKDWGWFPVVIARRFAPDPVLDGPQQPLSCQPASQRSRPANRGRNSEPPIPPNRTTSLKTRNAGNVPELFSRTQLLAPRKFTTEDMLAALGG